MPATLRRSVEPGRRRHVASRFIDALLSARLPVIMEVKRQDGDGNPLMGERTVEEIVGEYVAAGASCISVVTGRWFGGNDEMLREAAACTARSEPGRRRHVASRFIDALLSARLPVIMEVKRQDGDGNPLMGERTVEEIVGEYVAAGASCISVVTGRWFGGNDEMLREAAACTD